MKIDKIIKNTREERAFILCAVASNSLPMVHQQFNNFLDNNGYAEFYDMVIEIVDEMLYGEGSEFIKAVNNREKNEWSWWEEKHNTCFDWYHMDLADVKFKERLKGWETTLTADQK